MLIIRKEQKDILSQAQEKQFIADMNQYIQTEFPEKISKLPKQDVRNIVLQAMEESKGYGITEKPDICRFINLLFIFGFDFDKKLPWARDILNDPTTQLGSSKMLELYEEATNQL